MENRTKRGLELSAAIIALIYCIIDLIIEIIDFVSISEYLRYVGAGVIVGFIIGICLVVAEFVISIKLLATKANSKAKGARIAFIVITSIITVFFLIYLCVVPSGYMSIIGMIIFITVLVLELSSMSMSMEDKKNNFQRKNLATDEYSVEDKIKELKHLLDLGVITQEVFESAVDRIVKKLI